ncbi:hypothetical protein AFLA70_18g005560 [Aspergillus flavus AF70]|nr:hypothetical protein AFLA70_18g005560 [Aspergillus flavus AF70]
MNHLLPLGGRDLGMAIGQQPKIYNIHIKVDVNGFIWVNPDANEIPEISWEEHCGDVDRQERNKACNFDDYELDHTYQLSGSYNWKIPGHFNECYHCPTTLADIPEFLDLSFDRDTKDGHFQHHCVSSPGKIARQLYTASTYYFLISAMVTSPHFMMDQKFLPRGPNSS